MKLHRCTVFFLIFVAALPILAVPGLQSTTIRVQPQNPSGGCSLISADGGATSSYATTADGTFAFLDPLPPDAALSHLVVTASLLSACPTSNRVQVTLNAGSPDIRPDLLLLQPKLKTTSVASCTNPTAFQRVGTATQSISGYLRGGQNSLQFAEVADGTCSVLLEYVELTFYYWTDLPTITFDVTNSLPERERMVLTHKYRTDDDYPSSFQRSVPFQNRDGSVMITGTATNPDGTPYANQPIYVRFYDPIDPSQYIPASAHHAWDNQQSGSFRDQENFSLPLYNALALPWYVDTTDASGRFQTILTMTRQFAGDNAAVEASAVPLALPLGLGSGECPDWTGCSRSGTFTMWKRMYLEVDQMFRSGAFLAQDALAGSTQIEVDNPKPWAHATATNPIPITLIHTNFTRSRPGAPENLLVIRTQGRRLTLDAPLAFDYYMAHSLQEPREFAGDAVGRTDLGTFIANTSLATALLRTAYVDYVILPNAMPLVPFVTSCESGPMKTDHKPYCTEIASRWIDNQASGHTLNNHQHLVGAYYGGEGEIGHAAVGQFGNYPTVAFVWNGQIEKVTDSQSGTSYSGLSAFNMISETAAHEVVHLYDVNPPAVLSSSASVPRTGGHCTLPAWDGGNCVMSGNKQPAEYADLKVSLHAVSGIVNCDGICPGMANDWGNSEYRRIRYQKEPLPEVLQQNQDAW